MDEVIIYNEEKIASLIYIIRGKRVMIDSDLAMIYKVETRTLNQAVSRNKERFPEDFMFQLSKTEFENLKSQFVMSSWGGRRSLPFAFTEHGSLMLASVLKSKIAVQASISIVRAFVKLREILSTNKDLANKIAEMEKNYDEQFRVVFSAIRQLMEKPKQSERKPLGYKYKNRK
ncbi:MAG: ORF6N domain-containing protein [Chlorobi bacterium]|nr:ORF6N domain-containing protein [Chlorobiota bacterium]